MPRNLLLLLLVLTVIGVSALFTIFTASKNPDYKPGVSVENDNAVGQAQVLYNQKKVQGVDFSTGPCLTNDLLPDWVADIVHSPRQPIDDKPENQCQAFREGRATHFIELDLNGKLVRVK